MKACRVQRAEGRVELDADWYKPVWQDVPELTFDCHMGSKPVHRPDTRAKVLYDSQNIYVIFRCRDRYVKAVEEKSQGQVCCDSCVEFFFTPGDELSGYFNFELNCFGVYRFHYQTRRNENMVLVDKPDCDRIKIARSLPFQPLEEIQEPVEWTVEVGIPVDMLSKYYSAYVSPEPGALWRANFYKCADETSHPHWLTWAPVDCPVPDFHRPDSFGSLAFV